MIRHAFFDALRETMGDLMPAVVVEVTTVVVRRIETAARRDLNHNQSTHTASVHKSVSLALKNLNQHYASPVVGTVQEAIARLASLIRIDKKKKEKHAVAIRCLQGWREMMNTRTLSPVSLYCGYWLLWIECCLMMRCFCVTNQRL